MVNVAFVSLGCSKNRVDTERMMALCESAGYNVISEETEAQVVVINTCAFIESAKQESIENILDIAWLKENHNLKLIIVTGCLSERYKEQVLAEFPEVDAVLGTGSFDMITSAIENALNGNKYSNFADVNTAKIGGDRILSTPEYSVYLKVADGCDNRCTYCAIPGIRGAFRSRPIEEIVEEAIKLEKSGAKEINLIAQDTTRYGEDLYGTPRLVELLREITKRTNVPWIRILYCYPDRVSDELIQEIASNPRIVKYIDLPIQHISDPVLKAMNRRGDSNKICATIKKLRENIKDVTIRTTIITGFPGESEEDFETLCTFIEQTKFCRLGVFSYSKEEDTPAYSLENQIDPQTAQDRNDILMQMQMQIATELQKRKIGQTLRVLCEGYDPVGEVFFARSEADAPDIDTKVFFTTKNKKRNLTGKFVDVIIRDVMEYDLIGEEVNL